MCTGNGGSCLYEELVCVPGACDVRVTVAASLKEKLTLKSPDEVDTAVWNPRHREDAGADKFRECEWSEKQTRDRGDAREFESVGTPARMTIATRRLVRNQMSSASCCAMSTTTPFAVIGDSAGFQI